MNSDPVEILKQLTKFPTYQDPKKQDEIPEGMIECSRFLKDHLEALGFNVKVDELCNVTGERKFDGKGTFLLNAHSDTVPPSSEWKDYLEPKIIGNRLQGLGVTDDKGSIAGILSPLSTLDDCRFGKLTVQFVNYEDNAITYKGQRWLGMPFFLSKNPGFKIDYGINAEPTVVDDRICVEIGCGGRISFEVKAIGIEAHSSRPHLGRNAIYDMTAVINAIRVMPPGEYKIEDFEAKMPVNVAKIQGGRAINIVPGDCTINCERRLLPGEDPKAIEKEIRSELNKLEGIKIESKFSPRVQLPYHVDKSEHVVKLVTDAISRTLEYKPSIRIGLGRTDAVYLYHNAGIKTVIIGPGELDMCHKPYEFIRIDRLYEFTRVMKTLLSKND